MIIACLEVMAIIAGFITVLLLLLPESLFVLALIIVFEMLSGGSADEA